MPLIKYEDRNLRKSSLVTIAHANEIIAEYQAQGLSLTLRQLYYQFVARDLLANTQRNYQNLGNTISDGRIAGLIDWDSIEDRTRNVKGRGHWNSPEEIMRAVAVQFSIDLWKGQKWRPEVWVEKEALAGVIEPIATELDVPSFACRGYTSQSEIWGAAQRLRGYIKSGRKPVIVHLGDHDPSGLDMTRDIRDRLEMFTREKVKVVRIALNMDQVNLYNPPPNAAKATDCRFANYQAEFGDESWELDALNPTILATLIRAEVAKYRNDGIYATREARQEKERESLTNIAERWDDVASFLDGYDAAGEDE